MSDAIKSTLAGIAATPLVLLFTLGVGLASGLNLHFLLFSVLAANLVGLLFHRNAPYLFNIGPGLVVLMFTFNSSLEMGSGYLPTFLTFVVPAFVFTILSFLPIKYVPIPNRAIAPLAFSLGVILVLRQLPQAFAYVPPEIGFTHAENTASFLSSSTLHNWVQLALALFIPVAALIGGHFKKGALTLLLASFLSIGMGYILGYGTSLVQCSSLKFNQVLHLNWTFSPTELAASLSNGITLTVVMLMGFWGHFSTLSHDQVENKTSFKHSLRVVGIGNLIGGLFGVMPTNVSLIDSLSLRAFGGKSWIGKLPIILILLIVAIVGVPDFHVPLYAFAGILIYVGVLLIVKSWKLIKQLKPVEYFFVIPIALVFLLGNYTSGFLCALIYACVHYLLNLNKKKLGSNSQSLDTRTEDREKQKD